MIIFITILASLLVLNVLLLVFSVNKTNKKSSSGLDKIYFRPNITQMEIEENHQYSIS